MVDFMFSLLFFNVLLVNPPCRGYSFVQKTHIRFLSSAKSSILSASKRRHGGASNFQCSLVKDFIESPSDSVHCGRWPSMELQPPRADKNGTATQSFDGILQFKPMLQYHTMVAGHPYGSMRMN